MAKTHLGLRLPVKPPRLPSNIERRNQSRHRSRSNPAVNLHTCSCAESPLKGSRGILVEFSTVTYAKKHICRWPENCVGRTAFQICNEFFCCLTAATIATWLANTNPAPHPAPHTWGSKGRENAPEENTVQIVENSESVLANGETFHAYAIGCFCGWLCCCVFLYLTNVRSHLICFSSGYFRIVALFCFLGRRYLKVTFLY